MTSFMPSPLTKVSNSMSSAEMAEATKGLPRRVSWSSFYQMEFIESRAELSKDELWYNKIHFNTFRNDAVNEMRAFMLKHGISDPEDCMTKLYQPEPEQLPETSSPSEDEGEEEEKEM